MMYKKCIPFAYAKSIFEINYENLSKQGVTTLFFDLDNTIIDYNENVVSGKNLEFLENLTKTFNVAVVSNSKIKRVKKAMSLSNIPYIHFARKPLKIGFKKALKIYNAKPSEVAMVGDQIMTDCLGANRMKFKPILVTPVAKKTDHIYTRFNRVLERHFIKKIKKKCPDIYNERLKPYVGN